MSKPSSRTRKGSRPAKSRLLSSEREVLPRERETLRQLAYEKAIAECAALLLQEDDLERAATEFLAILGRATDVSRVYIFENSRDQAGRLLTSQRYEWVNTGVTPQIDNPALQGFCYEEGGFGRWVEVLGRGEDLCGLVEDFPASEHGVLKAQDIISILILPVFIGRDWSGFIGFDECRFARRWRPEEIRLLRAAAEVLGMYLGRSRMQAALRRSAREKAELLREYEKLLYLAPVPTVITRLDGTILLANRACCEALGLRAEEFVGGNVLALGLYGEGVQRRAELMERLRERGQFLGEEVKLRKVDTGEEVHGLLSSYLLEEYRGAPAALTMGLDITARMRTEAQLRESEERYRQLVEMSPEGITISREGRFLFLNQAAVELLGASRAEELMGRPVLDFVHPDFRQIVAERMEEVSEGKKTPLLEQKLLRLDGTPLEVETTAILFTYQGRPAVQTVIRDITARRRAEAVRLEKERLEGVLEMARAAAHELNQPLTALAGLCDVVCLEVEPGDPLYGDLKRIKNLALDLGQITRKISRIVKYSTKPYPGGVKIVDIDQASGGEG